ncbi:glutathione transferase GST 23-like [Tasmannia lanceolata]|uniref:glutathione transferase GST 23-like n=1 Tax=Tasmannia lanceolata TaxID=3420 RepID=UPI0040649975
MASQELKLFGAWMSPLSGMVEWALKLKGIEYEYVEEDLQNKSSLLLQYNPIHKKIPVLLHRGQPIIESAIILEYIDETWKENPILPQDPYERAVARFLADLAQKKCLAAIWMACCSEKEKERAPESSAEALKALDEEIKGRKFFGGESIGYLDLRLGWLCHWLDVFEEVAGIKVMDSQKYPSLNAWIKNFREVPIIKESLPARTELAPFFHELAFIRRF